MTYAITQNGKTNYVVASSRDAACKKLTGLGFKSAKELGQIDSAKKVSE